MNWISGALFVAVCGVMVQCGRLMERQKVHSEALKEHDKRLDDLEEGATEIVELRAEMRGLREAVAGLRVDLLRVLERV